MASILILGAGRSATSLIEYLLDTRFGHQVTVGDVTVDLAREKTANHANAQAIAFDINQPTADAHIAKADVVISMLPPFLHPLVAAKCLQHRKHMLTASYVSDDMLKLHGAAKESGLLFLNECGLDPGIDHMSAMQVIDRIRSQGGTLESFESFTGGLIAPDTDPQNPWRYKFTWNPRNVVMAGQGTARFLQDGALRYIPYHRLFTEITRVEVPGYGVFEGYANRDSLKYREAYGLRNIKTMLRGTLRNDGFCPAWNVLVQLGCTDDSFSLEQVDRMSHREFVASFLERKAGKSTDAILADRFALKSDGPEMVRLRWAGLFDDTPVGLQEGTPARVLEHILNKRWKLNAGDLDMVVMWHRFKFMLDGKRREVQSSLVAIGEDELQTAMARTVGLPLGMAANQLLAGKIRSRGVVIPTTPEFYEPILTELGQYGIALTERETH